MTPAPPESDRPVWIRKSVLTTRCPRSIIRAESTGWLDLYAANQAAGARLNPLELDARSVEALLVIEGEHRKEREEGATNA